MEYSFDIRHNGVVVTVGTEATNEEEAFEKVSKVMIGGKQISRDQITILGKCHFCKKETEKNLTICSECF